MLIYIPTSVTLSTHPLTHPLHAQKSLGGMGIDTTAAVERVRSESRGRKRTRGAEAEGGDQDMEDAQETKRVHSSKSRWAQLKPYNFTSYIGVVEGCMFKHIEQELSFSVLAYRTSYRIWQDGRMTG